MAAYFGLFMSVVMYATLGPMAKKIGLTMPPFALLAWSSLIMGAIGAILSVAFERGQVVPDSRQIHFLGFVFLYAFVNCVASAIYYTSIKYVPIVHYDIMALITPIIGGLLAVWLLGEPFHARYLVGLAIVSIGIFVAIRPF